MAAACVALSVFAVPAAAAQGTPAGTVIQAWATATYDFGGVPYTTVSDTASFIVAQVSGADVEPPRVSSGALGAAVIFPHTLVNAGNGPDAFTLAAVSTRGWAVALYRDVNGDGLLGAGDTLITAPLTLGYAGQANLLLQVTVPNVRALLGTSDTILVSAASLFDAAATDQLTDRLDVPAAALAVSLGKLADRATAAAGDVITYTLSYAAAGAGFAAPVIVADTVPAGTTYVPGTLRLNGAPLTDAVGDDAGALEPSGNGVVTVDLGSVAAGAAGTVTFQVRADAGPPRIVSNIALATAPWGGVTDTLYSGVAQTNILGQQLTLQKTLVGPAQALVGQDVRYTIRYVNAAGFTVTSAVLADTLPAGLDYVSAIPAPTTTGAVLAWTLGDLAPGDSGLIDVVLRVAASVRDTSWVRNIASLAATNAGAQGALAAQVALIGPPSTDVALQLTADVLEVGVGEAIPYTLIVRNTGIVPLTTIRIDNRLPGGARFAPGTAVGADSVWTAGEQLVLAFSTPLAPGAARTVRFAVALTTAPGDVAELRATATAQSAGGTAQSSAVAWVQVRRVWPMETRAAIGKVWLDVDGDGTQGAGDPGVAGVNVWTEDGEVATTDAQGRYSFSNLRAGRHAFRLDPRSLSADYRLVGPDLRLVAASGWTTPRVDFRLLPLAAGLTPLLQARRHPIEFTFLAAPVKDAIRPTVRYEATLRQETPPLAALVSFEPVADSAVVYVDGVVFTTYPWMDQIAIPFTARAGAEIRVVAWSSQAGDSATARLHLGAERFEGRARVHNPLMPITVRGWAPTVAGLPATPATPAVAVVETLSVSPARSAAARADERRASLTRGPGVEFVAPVDGAVLAADRVYVGLKGEPGAMVVLYDGAAVLDSVQMRVDGRYDFVALPLARGPHALRVASRNSWNEERWDSLALHVTGLPARFEAPARITLAADGRSEVVTELRVLDAWGVPVAVPAYVTVRAEGVEVVGRDADPSSVGVQLLSSASGRLVVALKPGREVRRGALALRSGDARAELPLEVLPEVRPLTVAGSGLVGVGASPDAYGAITAQGRLDARTAVTVSVDSRRLDAGQDAYGRTSDPLAEAQYPILGDASAVRTRSASQTAVSARLERGFDWVGYGDVTGSGFGAGLALAQYSRALTGFAGRVTTGPVTWSGFGSFTAQALRQLQLRGAAVSGPYELGAGVRPGTEVLRIETRALDNPEHAIVTQALTRYVDYQIDYGRGVVLFTQPVPAADVRGNPVFIVATYEAEGGGAQKLVAGGRAALDLRALAGASVMDSLRIGFTAVSAEQGTDPYRLVGADLRVLRVGALDVGAEVAFASQGDSSGLATAAKASFGGLNGAFTIGASFLNVSREFSNPANVALRAGTTALELRGGLTVGPAALRAEHSWQRFTLDGVDRRHTRIGVVQSFGRGLSLDAGVASEAVTGGSSAGASTTGEAKVIWRRSPAVELWAGGRRHLAQAGALLQPDYWGFGTSYRVSPRVALDGSHRYVTLATGGSYAVSDIGVRANVAPGTEAWSSYQMAGGVDGARSAAIVGLRNQLRLSPALALNVLFERRMGVGAAPAADPVRALPFLQAEDNYWAAGLGLDLAPAAEDYRLSAKLEYKDGVLQSNRLVMLAGEATFDQSLGLLSRQELVQRAQPGMALARRVSSLWGVAFRPSRSDRVNVLAKVQWTDERNPIGGGVLVAQGAERRLILAGELIWTPAGPAGVELGVRYAARTTEGERNLPGGVVQHVESRADYVGGRASMPLRDGVTMNWDARLLLERTSGTTRWDLAPAVAVRIAPGLLLSTGYRFGDLSDPDFSVRGGHGLFLTLEAAVSEISVRSAVAFWRKRI